MKKKNRMHEKFHEQVFKFLSHMEGKKILAKTLTSLTKFIIIKDLICFQIMDLTDEERAMQAQVN